MMQMKRTRTRPTDMLPTDSIYCGYMEGLEKETEELFHHAVFGPSETSTLTPSKFMWVLFLPVLFEKVWH
ncbi:hypothetical protein DPMN_004681 [Dreissena polymorpha]|uniref:Uncharacterized protein n=1 Tax=Dreissena polymorpha TaxID=45954 RepID=A0A9D4MRR6_DREPO|nr:hypothetical protein DPMN_004681 [Dreissena polymorpha]